MECPLCCKRKPIRQKKEKKTYEIVSKLLSSIFQRNIVATLATKPELLVARRKVLVALVTGISVEWPCNEEFCEVHSNENIFQINWSLPHILA